MRAVPSWAVATAAAAPVLLVAGSTVAAARQPAGYDPVRDTISELAGVGATDSWLMAACLVLLGCCYLGTALVLHAAGLPSRFLLAVGGMATIALIAFPRPQVGGSPAHGTVATVAVLALSLWPAGSALRLPRAVRRGVAASPAGAPPWAFRRPVALAVTAVLLLLFGWFVVEVTGGSRTGLAERVAALAVALWPLAAVLSARRAHRRWSARPAGPPVADPSRPGGPPVSPGRPGAGG
ncbi:DUF998 domain-containing protein [Micromonospora sp. A3M-1-15]|uniref:DUF998 domain-containing protein n=1 Tax=Micromonospora sp. A3M-1-15 TaxID=2962035 RepID=UPI0020B66203|nr:DUF998 domain-containing protein [Micromonospora sp. A3M-1-15]MCP3781853.1 DUF998 domain-containing protein [Micromonospora sp. A3M-1-15]